MLMLEGQDWKDCWKVPAKPGLTPSEDSEAPWKALGLLGVES